MSITTFAACCFSGEGFTDVPSGAAVEECLLAERLHQSTSRLLSALREGRYSPGWCRIPTCLFEEVRREGHVIVPPETVPRRCCLPERKTAKIYFPWCLLGTYTFSMTGLTVYCHPFWRLGYLLGKALFCVSCSDAESTITVVERELPKIDEN